MNFECKTYISNDRPTDTARLGLVTVRITIQRCIMNEKHGAFGRLLDVGFQFEYLLLATHVNVVLQCDDFRRLLGPFAGMSGHLFELVADALHIHDYDDDNDVM